MTKKPLGTVVSRPIQSSPVVYTESRYINAIESNDIIKLKTFDSIRFRISHQYNEFKDAIMKACIENYDDVVVHLLENSKTLGVYPLGHTIIGHGNKDMINALALSLTHGPPTELFVAIGKRHPVFLQQLCENVDINKWHPETRRSFLEGVASFSDVATMKSAMDKNPTFTDPASIVETSLFRIACENGNVPVAKYLFERKGGSVNPAGIFESFNHNHASKRVGNSFMRDLNFFKTLVRDERVENLENAFRMVVTCDNVIALEWLLENMNARKPDRLIIMTAHSNALRCLDYLLARTDVNPAVEQNAALIYCIKNYASSGDSLYMIKALLLDSRVDPSAQENKAILIACGKVTRGISEVVRLLLQDPRVNPSVNDNEALGHAVRLGQEETVRVLLQHPGVKVNNIQMMYDTLDKIRKMKLKNPEPFINSCMMLIPRLQPMPKFAKDSKMEVLLPRLAESRLRILSVLQLCERGGYSSNVPCGNNVVGLPDELFRLIINFMGEPYQGRSLETLRLFLLKKLQEQKNRIKTSLLLLDSSSEQMDFELADFIKDIYPLTYFFNP